MSEGVRSQWRPGWAHGRLPLTEILGPLVRGKRDPTCRWEHPDAAWLAMRTPQGPATLRVRQSFAPDGQRSGSARRALPAEAAVEFVGYGPGAAWAVAGGPALLGARDDPDGFVPHHPLVARTWRRLGSHRLPSTGRLWEALLLAVLEQRVTGKESAAAWYGLLRRHGDAAPGPAPEGMSVPPGPQQVRRIPDWEWHRLGVDGNRRRTVRAVAGVGESLERVAAGGSLPDIARALRTVPGVGPWTVAETLQRACGDRDAVSVGDYHLAAFVGWSLVGRPVSDEGMLELLEPYRGQRYRAVRMLELSGFSQPRFGPRMTVADMRGF